MSEEPGDGAPSEINQDNRTLEASTANGIVSASGVMAVGTIASRATGVLRDTAVRIALGTAVLADTFAVANTIPNTLYAMLAGGVISAVFVPQLVRHLKEDDDGGDRYTQRLLTLATLGLVAITVVAVLAAPLIVRLFATRAWSAEDFHVATLFAVFCLPQILFYGLYTMFQQVLNARGHFAAPMFAPILNNIVAIVTCGLFIAVAGRGLTTSTITDGQIALLGIGTTVGIAVQALVLVPVMRRTGFRWKPRFDFRNAGLGKAGSLAKWSLVYVATSQIAFIVIVKLATRANTLDVDGTANVGLASYQAANLIFQLPQSVITLSVVTAMLPALSAHAIGGQLRRLTGDLLGGMRLALVGIVPATVALLVLAPSICLVLFGYGATTTADAEAIGHVAQYFVLGLIPYTVFFVLIRGFFALEDTKTPAMVNLALNVLNVVLALVFFQLAADDFKVQSLAATYLPTYAFAAFAAWFLLRRRVPELEAFATVRTGVRLVVAAVPAGLIMWACSAGAVAVLGDTHLAALVGIVLALVLGGLAFVGIAHRLRVHEMGALVGLVRGKLAS